MRTPPDSRPILVVTGDAQVMMNVGNAVAGGGLSFFLRVAPTVEEGLARITSGGEWALVVLDVASDELHELALCRALRADNRTASILILALADSSIRADALAAGCNDLAPRSSDPAELVEVMRRLL
jgi:CheY-like chemotaxis protein